MGANRRWTDAGLPLLTPHEREAMQVFLEIQEAHQDELQAATLQFATEHAEFGPLMRSLTPAQVAQQNRQSRELTRGAIAEDRWEPYLEHSRAQGATYARMGLSLTGWFDLVTVYQGYLIPYLLADPARMAQAVLGMTTFINIGMAVLGEEYLRTKESIIGQQQAAIRELSTPVLQVRDRMLILPIIGVIDTQRARQLTEQLLHAIRAHRARAVVMDITGVAAVDSKVANHLLQTISAARLMGARVVVTGVSSDVAHSLVTLGVDTSQINTTGDLQSGIEDAERWLGYRVGRVDDPLPQAGQE